MIREFLKPKTNEIVIKIPDSYINEELELIIFAFSEIENQKNVKGNSDVTRFAGSIANDESENMIQCINECRCINP